MVVELLSGREKERFFKEALEHQKRANSLREQGQPSLADEAEASVAKLIEGITAQTLALKKYNEEREKAGLTPISVEQGMSDLQAIHTSVPESSDKPTHTKALELPTPFEESIAFLSALEVIIPNTEPLTVPSTNTNGSKTTNNLETKIETPEFGGITWSKTAPTFFQLDESGENFVFSELTEIRDFVYRELIEDTPIDERTNLKNHLSIRVWKNRQTLVERINPNVRKRVTLPEKIFWEWLDQHPLFGKLSAEAKIEIIMRAPGYEKYLARNSTPNGQVTENGIVFNTPELSARPTAHAPNVLRHEGLVADKTNTLRKVDFVYLLREITNLTGPIQNFLGIDPASIDAKALKSIRRTYSNYTVDFNNVDMERIRSVLSIFRTNPQGIIKLVADLDTREIFKVLEPYANKFTDKTIDKLFDNLRNAPVPEPEKVWQSNAPVPLSTEVKPQVNINELRTIAFVLERLNFLHNSKLKEAQIELAPEARRDIKMCFDSLVKTVAGVRPNEEDVVELLNRYNNNPRAFTRSLNGRARVAFDALERGLVTFSDTAIKLLIDTLPQKIAT